MTPTKIRLPNTPEFEEESPLNIGDVVGLVVALVVMAAVTAFSYLVLDHYFGELAGYVGAVLTLAGIAYGLRRIIK